MIRMIIYGQVILNSICSLVGSRLNKCADNNW